MSEIEDPYHGQDGADGNGRYSVPHAYPALRTEVQDVRLDQPLQQLWVHRRLITLWTAVFVLGGILFVIGSRREYRATAVLLPEKVGDSKSGGMGLLQQFGGLIGGIDASGLLDSENALTVELYPDVLESTPLQLALLNKVVEVPALNAGVTLRTYLDEHLPFSIGDAPGALLSSVLGGSDRSAPVLQDTGIVSLGPKDRQAVEALRERLDTQLDKKKGTLTVEVEMPSPQVAAQVAHAAVGELATYITAYHTKKLTDNLRFLEERHREARERFEAAANAKALFSDRNYNLARDLAGTEGERLEAEFNVAYNVYSTLASQVEEARLRIQEETPVFQVLQPVTVPYQKSSPQTILILIMSLLLGFVTSAIYVLVQPSVRGVRRVLRQAETRERKAAVSA